MLALLATPFLLALAAPWLVRTSPRSAPRVFAAALAALCVHTLLLGDDLAASGGRLALTLDWVPSLDLAFALSLDDLARLFVLLVTGLGATIFAFAGAYFGPRPDLGRTYAILLVFTGAMLGLVLADDPLLLFVFWELTSVTSYLLVGHSHEDAGARTAARRALFVTGAGGLALLVGLLLLTRVAGVERLSALPDHGRLADSALGGAALALCLLGALTKSAQWPFHGWLPGAMAAPTPVSAFLHSATMVKAGVYLLARLHPAFGASPWWHATLTGAGAVTMLLGALLAVFQDDLKRVLAYTTISALGTLVLLLGLGSDAAVHAALLLLLVHALYKAALFMVVGAVDHAAHTRSLARLSGLRRAMPALAAAALLAALSMAGLPPLLGFIAKELVYEAKLGAGALAPWVTGAGFLANAAMIASAVLVGWRPFAGRPRDDLDVHAPTLGLWLPPALAAGAGLVLGLLPDLLAGDLVDRAAQAVHGETTSVDLALWHGLNPVLALSALTVASGLLLAAGRDALLARATRLARWARFGPTRAVDLVLERLPRVGAALGRLLPERSLHGQLVLALLVVALALAAAAGTALSEVVRDGTRPELHWPVLETSLVLLTAAAGVGVVRARRRVGAVAALGLVGLGVSLLFLVHGGPDLAMTQLAVEALAVLLLVLVLVKLPARDADRRRVPPAHLALALLVGAGLAAGTALASLGDPPRALSEALTALSVPFGKGRNVVNVILVDFRSLDTLGEITVLAAAAVGVVALLRRPRSEDAT
ncbi:MAG: DUF4040 domain-containing protein [Planctomycetes bacterium]|nr:DUF4040 domain-containing protein [Planctomycetota bacterium]